MIRFNLGGDHARRWLPENVTEDLCGRERAVFCASVVARGQDGRRDAPSGPPPSEATPEIRVLADLIRDLQAQVSALNSQFKRTTNRGTTHGRGGS